MSAVVSPLSEADFGWVLALSRAHEAETSSLDRDALAGMHGDAYRCTKIGDKDGYLISFDQDASYTSPNFLWFRERYPAFAYVDRIVIDPGARRRGYAHAMYRDLFGAASRDGHTIVCCEVNVAPPNPISDAFHAQLDFVEAGRATFQTGKIVRYLVRSLESKT